MTAVQGVGPSWVALPHHGDWPTVLAFLTERFPHVSKGEWIQRMARGDVQTDTAEAIGPLSPFIAGVRIRYLRHVAHEVPIPFAADIVFEDEHIVVVDKPHFLPVTPSGGYVQETLLARLRAQLACDTLAPMHRLDRDTAGLVLFSKQTASRGAYHGLFSQRAIRKTYEAVAPWAGDALPPALRSSRVEESSHFMQMHEVVGEPNAETRIRVLEHTKHWARYELQPVTGKRHQLRVHMNALGLPIRFDGIYPTLTAELASGTTPDYSRPLQLLARRLNFVDPLGGQQRNFVSGRQLLALPD